MFVRANSGGGGGSKCASGYYASGVPSSITTTDITTGESFKPTKLIISCRYVTNNMLTQIYDASVTPNPVTYRYNTTQSQERLPVSTGIKAITTTGFTLNTNSSMTEFTYMAIG